MKEDHSIKAPPGTGSGDGNKRRRKLDSTRGELARWLRDDGELSPKEIAGRLRPMIGHVSEQTVRRYLADCRASLLSEPSGPLLEPRASDTPTEPSHAGPSEELLPADGAPATPASGRPIPEFSPEEGPDYKHPDYYLNRELTWLNFNFRVLQEAADPRTPLLERLKFISIVSSNLDEFFMKRIGGLKQQVGAGMVARTVDGRTPQEQIDECLALVRELVTRKRIVLRGVLTGLGERGVEICRHEQLSESEREFLRAEYLENIYPLVTPQATDPAHPFPFISNLSLNLYVILHYANDTAPCMARVKVPIGSGIPRLMKLPEGHRYALMEEVMAANLDLLFPEMIIDSVSIFRVTRNANTEREEERANDLLAMIEDELRDRKFAPVVRLEVSAGMDASRRDMLAAELGLDAQSDVFEVEGILGMRDIMELCAIKDAELHDPPHHPVDHPDLTIDRNIFHVIRDAGSLLLHHPYESFPASVERFLREASCDPKVRAIKMCLYRTSADTQAIRYLIDAARNGKQVAVVVELKARFDEEANIRWASWMEEVGIHVTYGVVGLKTHCKVILVVRSDFNGLRRYAHVGTGNYHAGTARLYSDLGLLTSDPGIGRDLTELLNYLTTGYKPKRAYHKLLPAPKLCKVALLQKIEREVNHQRAQGNGLIQIKMNALEDEVITKALYEASRAGVRIDMIIRDSCRLRPGIKHLSENIRVISVVGRFLEHARIVYFRNNGEEEYYIGSADLMKRNLNSRVEVLAPVEATGLREELRTLLDLQLRDRRSAWEMRSDGSYVQLQPQGDDQATGSQQALIEWYERRLRQATRLKRRKPRGIQRRNLR
ncbi:MAG: polyphosphate kinase 1 [Planctomycetota bacterium]